ncbi:MAG: creatininase family protein [Pseudomonadota bacterium]
MPEVEWQRLKAHELRLLATEDAVVILPIASIEQHGPHLPTMTDTRLGHAVAVGAAQKAFADQPTVVTPVVWSGLSEHHMPFGGTLTLSHDTFRRVIRDLVAAVMRHGFRKILLSNSHGGNIIALNQICDELAPTLDATLVATTYPTEMGAALGDILEDQKGMQHACEAETSMMMAVEPDLVDDSDLGAIGTQGEAHFLGAGQNSYRWRPFAAKTADGVAGRPEKATASKGQAIIDKATDAIAALITDPETWKPAGDLRGQGTAGVPFRDR